MNNKDRTFRGDCGSATAPQSACRR